MKEKEEKKPEEIQAIEIKIAGGSDADKVRNIQAQKMELLRDETGKPSGMRIVMSKSEGLLFELERFRMALGAQGGEHNLRTMELITKMLDFLRANLISLDYKYRETEAGATFDFDYKYSVPAGMTEEEAGSVMDEIFDSEIIGFVVAGLEGKQAELYEKMKRAQEAISRTAEEVRRRTEELEKKQKALNRKKPPRKQRVGKHLVDNMLMPGMGIMEQAGLFDTLTDTTKSKLLRNSVTPEFINRKGEGIRLGKGEIKALFSIVEILNEKSQTTDKKSSNYYTGNGEKTIEKITTTQGEVSLIAPRVVCTFYELAQKYTGNPHPGGKSIADLKKILLGLADDPEKKSLIRYTRRESLTTKGKGKEDKYRDYFIERYDSLIRLDEAGYEEIRNGEKVDERREIIITIHPIIRDQIEKLYVPIPTQTELIEAYGSPNISEITQLLILELSRAHTNKGKLPKDEAGNPVYSIGKAKLFQKIAPNYLPPNKKRIPLIEQYTEKSIATAEGLGIIKGHQIKPGATGELNYYFALNGKWK